MAYPPPGAGGYPPSNNPAYPPGGGYPPPAGPPGYGAPPSGPPGYGGAPPPGYGPPQPGFAPQPGPPGGYAPQPGPPGGYAPPPGGPYGQPQPGYGAPPQAGGPQYGRPFYIRSELHGKVLDIDGGNPSPGSRVIVWPRKPTTENNQLWYIDQGGCIRSKLNDMYLDASHGRLQMQPYNGNPKQMFMFQGNRIVNRSNPNEVVDIANNDCNDGAEVCCWNYNGGGNQHWAMDYC